ncbi:hypothetical protein TorRG33x02_353690 [Trema orientale]|uniref:Uncharacterized protein n=1 Tax=Trema orientale TaxID=63057 RepID=A0A2P5ACH1_TREOI|nr:hypothetical protein TorRG33x02_353690 [Trema orientale]
MASAAKFSYLRNEGGHNNLDEYDHFYEVDNNYQIQDTKESAQVQKGPHWNELQAENPKLEKVSPTLFKCLDNKCGHDLNGLSSRLDRLHHWAPT